MATTEERLKILQMVADGKINPNDAAQLLEALQTAQPNQPRQPFMPGEGSETPPVPGRRPRFLRVRVTDTDTGRPRVNVRLPIGMVSVGLKMGTRFAPQVEGLDAEQLMSIIESGEMGQIVDVYDEEDGEHVEVFLE